MATYVIIVELRIRSGRMAEFLPLIEANAKASRTHEPGCRRFDVLVPESMRESYASKTGETVTAEAIYSNFRRFETAGRLVPN